MVNQIKYSIGALLTIPFLPIMYYQGKKIRQTIPSLPEAKQPEGVEGHASQKINLLALGESTIAGVGVDLHQNGFTGALARHLHQQSKSQINWKVVAQSGYTANQVAQQLIPKIGAFPPDIIVIGLGGNDAFQLNSPLRWRSSLNALFTGLNNIFPNSKIICLNMPPIKEFPAFTSLIRSVMGNLVELLGAELKNIVQDYDNVYYIDQQITFRDWIDKQNHSLSPQDFFSDGVHPSELTYQIWGNEVGEFIVANELL